jgi:hypothetical protein
MAQAAESLDVGAAAAAEEARRLKPDKVGHEKHKADRTISLPPAVVIVIVCGLRS